MWYTGYSYIQEIPAGDSYIHVFPREIPTHRRFLHRFLHTRDSYRDSYIQDIPTGDSYIQEIPTEIPTFKIVLQEITTLSSVIHSVVFSAF